MKVLLIQLDGKIPNIALMRLAAYHGDLGNDVELRHAPTVGSVERRLGDSFDKVYASLIFERTKPVANRLLRVYPEAILGGTGWDVGLSLESIGVTTKQQDYSIYPKWMQSIGFTQRGCRLACPFCVVPRKEGKVRKEASVWNIWRGDPWPRQLILLDNDFFGEPSWQSEIEAIQSGGFRVSFNQGINARFLTDETAAAVASVDYRDDQMKCKRIYTAWDNRKDEDRLFRGLDLLVKHGVRPDNIMVYILVGYWDGETSEDRDYRRRRLREFGCRPYPMPYVRTPELVAFQRWVVRRADLVVSWKDYWAVNGRPERLKGKNLPMPLFDGMDF